MKSICVIGLGFGDEGKGTVVDYLCSQLKPAFVCRFNGGHQAAHNVVTTDGRHHTFSQFGSGTLRGIPTYIGPHTVIEFSALYNEADHLKQLGIADPFSLLYIDRSCLVTTPMHKAINRLREIARGSERHGSCGVGVGETKMDVSNAMPSLTVYDVLNGRALARMKDIKSLKMTAARSLLGPGVKTDRFKQEFKALQDIDLMAWADFYNQVVSEIRFPRSIAEVFGLCAASSGSSIIFEGAQGVLLDMNHGFGPYKTYGVCTDEHAKSLHSDLEQNHIGARQLYRTIGVIRSYASRHGAGPFPTEDKGLTEKLIDKHNGPHFWQGDFRVGYFDGVLYDYAFSAQKVNYLAVTHLDRYIPTQIATKYENLNQMKVDLGRCKPIYTPVNSKNEFYEYLHCPVVLESFGPTSGDKMKTKAWAELLR